ncbi:hypothetical protein K2173_016674 [Erythroxylum novogranatense]|uniref:TCP domain-containing protein n=1 Tax=Erythroxylum novogranatense TaxID=1862640 RepID=A0AAV8ST89_9ROSI|nr:hypothetical protein K2173_016674 [Erythroxylum novogranatense]
MGQNHQQASATSSRLGIRSGVGEIVEVQGGHIVRSTGRKDRHSKVCTAKGPRDRRVRLSAHTAIQFYDVQDRLGYDRPSKAVDWLIKKAKAAIDELAQLPAWDPTTAATTTTTTNTFSTKTRTTQEQQGRTNYDRHREVQLSMENVAAAVSATVSNDMKQIVANDVQNLPQQLMSENHNSSTFLTPSLDCDSIADTIKSFFPMCASVETTSSSSIQFQRYPPDFLSRTSSQAQDLRLSLHSFQEPILLPHHGQSEQQILFSGTVALGDMGFDGSQGGWLEHHHPAEISRFQRMVAWNAGDANNGGGGAGGGGGGGGFMSNTPSPLSPSPPTLLQPLFGHSQLFLQRGPLQSSTTPSVRAWIDPAITVAHHHPHEMSQIHHQDQSAISGNAFGFSGFHIPARIQGEDEEHDGIHNRPSSASSDSRH